MCQLFQTTRSIYSVRHNFDSKQQCAATLYCLPIPAHFLYEYNHSSETIRVSDVCMICVYGYDHRLVKKWPERIANVETNKNNAYLFKSANLKMYVLYYGVLRPVSVSRPKDILLPLHRKVWPFLFYKITYLLLSPLPYNCGTAKTQWNDDLSDSKIIFITTFISCISLRFLPIDQKVMKLRLFCANNNRNNSFCWKDALFRSAEMFCHKFHSI
jgi:hypothetical protein